MKKIIVGFILFFGALSLLADVSDAQTRTSTRPISNNLSVPNNLSVGGVLFVGKQGAIRDTAGGDLEFSENKGSSWTDFGSGGGTPGGSDTYVQYNDSGALGGDAGMTYNETTNDLSLNHSLSLTTGTLYATYDGTPGVNIIDKVETIDALIEFIEQSGANGAALSSSFPNLTIPGNLTINGVLFASSIAGGDWEIDGTFTALNGTYTNDLTVSDDLTVSGEVFSLESLSIPLDSDFSVTGADASASYLYSAPFPFVKGIVEELRLAVSQPLDGMLTVSVGRIRSGTFTELTGTTTRPFATSASEIGGWETGLLFQFLDTDYLAVKLHSFTRVDDLTRTGVELQGKVRVINVDD